LRKPPTSWAMTTRSWSRKKDPNGNRQNRNSQNLGSRRNINPHLERSTTCVFPNRKSCAPRRALIRGMSTFLRLGGHFRICRHCRDQVRAALRLFRTAPYVALTKLASTDSLEAAIWVLASNESQLSSSETALCAMSASGPKRTSLAAPHMSAYDPKPTWAPSSMLV